MEQLKNLVFIGIRGHIEVKTTMRKIIVLRIVVFESGHTPYKTHCSFH